MSANLVREKLAQATEILNELDIDLWLVVARESDTLGDPSLPLVVGTSVTWESAFLISRTGRHRAIVGTGDVENIKQTGAWNDVVGYVEGISEPLRKDAELLQGQQHRRRVDLRDVPGAPGHPGRYTVLEPRGVG